MTTTKTAITVSTLAGVFLFGGLMLYVNFSSIASSLTEKIATEALGVSVSIGSMEVSLPEKRITTSNIKVSNPRGYKNSHAFTIGSVSIQLNALSEELINLKEITVSDAVVNLEITENGTNLNDIKKYADENKKTKSQQPMRKVMIETIKMNASTINTESFFLENEQSIKMPPLAMHGIGVKENGIIAKEALAQIWSYLVRNVTNLAAKQGLLDGLSSELLKEIGAQDAIKNIQNKISQEVNSLTEGLGKEAGEIGDAIGNSIGNALEGAFGN